MPNPIEPEEPQSIPEIIEDDEPAPQDLGSSLFTPRTVISFLFALVILFFVIRRTNIDISESFRQMRQANLWYLSGAILAYYITFFLRGWRWKGMLASAGISEETGHKMPNIVGMFQIMTLSWFTNSILPARMGDAYRCYLIKRRSGASFGVSLGTMLAERLIDPADFDLLVIPGGGSPENLRISDEAVAFTRAFVESGRPTGAICHGAQLLISADVLKDKTLTAVNKIRDDVKNAGGNYVDEAIVVDGNLITSRIPSDLDVFNEALVKALK